MENPTPHSLSVREKLLMHGAKSLTDLELLTAFISSGSAQYSCLTLAKALLTSMGDLRQILKADIEDFQKIPGLGHVKFVQFQAATEISRRADLIRLQKNLEFHHTFQAAAYLRKQLRDQKNEVVVALFLDAKNRLITYDHLFQGSISSTTIYIRPIVAKALKWNAASMIIAHNHPSGCCEPSQHDIDVTRLLKEALHLIEVDLLDHLIIGDNEVYSIIGQYIEHCSAD